MRRSRCSPRSRPRLRRGACSCWRRCCRMKPRARPAAFASCARARKCCRSRRSRSSRACSSRAPRSASCPNIVRLGEWMHRVAGGVPSHCLELASDLINRGIVRYVGGTWLRAERGRARIVASGLGRSAESIGSGACRLRRARCSRRCRVHSGDTGATVVPGGGASATASRDVFACLDELLHEEVLTVSGDNYRFHQEALRNIVQGRLSDERKRALHAIDRPCDARAGRAPKIAWRASKPGSICCAAGRSWKAPSCSPPPPWISRSAPAACRRRFPRSKRRAACTSSTNARCTSSCRSSRASRPKAITPIDGSRSSMAKRRFACCARRPA